MKAYLHVFLCLKFMLCTHGVASLCPELLAGQDTATQRAKRVLEHFESTTKVSRDSYRERPFRLFMEAFARQHGREVVVQESAKGGGNLLVRVPPTPKYAASPQIVALSGHLDMVQTVDGEWLRSFPEVERLAAQQAYFQQGQQLTSTGGTVHTAAFRSTNGADNGIGLSVMMAMIEGGYFDHPALELVFTWGEEKGLHGAQEWNIPLRATKLITLDGEDAKIIEIGSKGAMMLAYELDSASSEPLMDKAVSFQVELTGLAGGHSGADVHRGRGNAAVIASKLLAAVRTQFPHSQVISASAGTEDLFTVIPSSFDLKIGLRASDETTLAAMVRDLELDLRRDLKDLQPTFGLTIANLGAVTGKAVKSCVIDNVIASLQAVPDAVTARAEGKGYSADVETSNNHSFLFISPDRIHTGFMPRSFVNEPISNLKTSIAEKMAANGLSWSVAIRADYPAWQPKENSPLVELARRTLGPKGYEFALCPGGIEPAIFLNKFPRLSAINFPPTAIRDAHSPKESFEVPELILGLEDLQSLLTAIGDERSE